MKRSGRYLEIIRDSQVDLNERLIIIFYDILLLDDIIYIKEIYNKRR